MFASLPSWLERSIHRRGLSLNGLPKQHASGAWGVLSRQSTKILRVPRQFEALSIRLMTEEATSHKRNTEDEIVAAFEVQRLARFRWTPCTRSKEFVRGRTV